MVDVTPPIPRGRQVIDAYGPGEFRVAGTLHRGPVLVFPDRTESWDVAGFADLSVESFRPVIETRPAVEVVLLGCGPRMALLPADLRRALREAGLAVDFMDTGAACRTYNVMMAEERRVCAALLPL